MFSFFTFGISKFCSRWPTAGAIGKFLFFIVSVIWYKICYRYHHGTTFSPLLSWSHGNYDEAYLQADMPATIAQLALGQSCQKQIEKVGGKWKHPTYIHWNHDQAQDAVQEDYWGPFPCFNDWMFEWLFCVSWWIVEDLICWILVLPQTPSSDSQLIVQIKNAFVPR
jgi:hypothetical protein